MERMTHKKAPIPPIIALYQPDIPQNTASIIRTCSCFGLKVEIIEPADPNDPPKQVAAGKIDIAISYQPQFHLQIDQSLPIVRLGSLVSTPLNSLVVLKNGPIDTIKDLKNKKIGFSVGGFEDALLSGMFERYGFCKYKNSS